MMLLVLLKSGAVRTATLVRDNARDWLYALTGHTWLGLGVAAGAALVLAWLSYLAVNLAFGAALFAHVERFEPQTHQEFLDGVFYARGARGEGKAAFDPTTSGDFPGYVTLGRYPSHPLTFDELREMRTFLGEALTPLKPPPGLPARDESPEVERFKVKVLSLVLARWLELDDDAPLPNPTEAVRRIRQARAELSRPVEDGQVSARKKELLGLLEKTGDKDQEVMRLPADVASQVRGDAVMQQRLLQLTPDGQGDADVVSLVMFPKNDAGPAAGSPFVLEVSRVRDGDGVAIKARYYLYRLGGRSGPVVVESSVQREVEVLRSRGSWLTGLRPVAVQITEAQLAQRFFREQDKIRVGAGLPQLTLEEVDRKQQQAFLERSLLLRLGLPQSEDGQPSHLRSYAPMESWTTWPRRLNGGDWLGLIQFATVVMFWLAMITGGAALGLILLQQRDVRRAREAFFPEGAGPDVDRTARLLLRERRGGFFAARLTTVPADPGGVERHLASRSSADYAWYGQYAPLAVAHDFYEEKGRGADRPTLRALLETQGGHAGGILDGHLSILRYGNWVIPSLGFLGTVIGISDALIRASGVLAEGLTERQAVIQQMAVSLGIAFDTTFVALALSLMTMALYQVLTRRTDYLMSAVKNALTDRIA